MRVLAMDTTAPPGSLALWEDGTVRLERRIQDVRPFGECLPEAVLDALRDTGWTLPGVDLFVVGSGPGSLTGLRVGIATAQGLAFACAKPLVGVSALEALAQAGAGGREAHLVVAWSDARRGEVFAQCFGTAGETLESIEGPVVGDPAFLASRWAALAAGRRVTVIGSAAAATTELWTSLAGAGIAFRDAPALASTMAGLGARAARCGLAGPPHALAPLYVRRPDAEVARDRAAGLAARPHGPR